jgi:hypothetical protein
MSLSDLVSGIKKLYDSMINELKESIDRKYFCKQTKKWYVQRVAYLFSRLMYLCPPCERKMLAGLLPSMIEFEHLKVVMDALISNDVTELINYSGSPVNTFCQLAFGMGVKDVNVSLPEKISGPQLDSIYTLLVYGVLQPPGSLPDIDLDGESGSLFAFAGSLSPQVHKHHDFSYEDELRCLQLSHKNDDYLNYISTRYSDAEDVSIDGVQLGNGGYY